MPVPPKVITDSTNETHQLLLKDPGDRSDDIKAASIIWNKRPNLVTVFYNYIRYSFFLQFWHKRLLTREFSTLEFSNFHLTDHVNLYLNIQENKGTQPLPKIDQSLQMLHLSNSMATPFLKLTTYQISLINYSIH